MQFVAGIIKILKSRGLRMRELEKLFSLKFLEVAAKNKATEQVPAVKHCKSCMKSEPEISFGQSLRTYTCLVCKSAAQKERNTRKKYMEVSYGIKPDIELKGNMK